MENNMPTAGPSENALSAKVSRLIFSEMLREANESGLQMGWAAVMTGVMDALARYVTTYNIYEAEPRFLADMMGHQIEQLLAAHNSGPAGTA